MNRTRFPHFQTVKWLWNFSVHFDWMRQTCFYSFYREMYDFSACKKLKITNSSIAYMIRRKIFKSTTTANDETNRRKICDIKRRLNENRKLTMANLFLINWTQTCQLHRSKCAKPSVNKHNVMCATSIFVGVCRLFLFHCVAVAVFRHSCSFIFSSTFKTSEMNFIWNFSYGIPPLKNEQRKTGWEN